ncbi:hypothetical protein C5167_011651 [Papaver somniferum]|uniref:Zinc knuckle CX2CX4HX4C domain-containing protein n=1 Tax=Papaver somniferum TaxID=3469 RepID=A0A4Y7K3M0_PAPSO|nr:hypothetical protein C5167_011651 [Papaver somniferum]
MEADREVIITITNRINVLIFRIHSREVLQIVLRERPHSIGGHLLVLLLWQFHMIVQNAIFQFEVFFIEFRLRDDLDRDNISQLIASQVGDTITIYNRYAYGVVKAKVRVDVNLPLVRKVQITLEDGEKIKVAIFYSGFPSATCRNCYVFNHYENYCGLIANIAWLDVPVLNLQGVDPFGDQVNNNEMEANIEGPMQPTNIHENPQVENVDDEIEIVNKEIEVAVQAIYYSELNVNDQRANKRRREEDVISDIMDMDIYSKEIAIALNRLAEEVSKDNALVVLEKGESSNENIVVDTSTEQGNTLPAIVSPVDAGAQVYLSNQFQFWPTQESGNIVEQAEIGHLALRS